MTNLPRLAVIVPARGGSKRIPRKNLALCAGRPLIDWTIEYARGALWGLERDGMAEGAIIVSTEDPEIAAFARAAGVSVLDRPAELATDEALTAPVIAHAVTQLDLFPGSRPDYVAVLQPTVPARPYLILEQCFARLLETGADSVHTAYPLHFVWWRESPAYAYTTDTGGAVAPTWRTQCPRRPRLQEMDAREIMFAEDGSVFLCRAELIRKTGQYVADPRRGGRLEIVISQRTIDVDDEIDLAVAEALLTYRKVLKEGTGWPSIAGATWP
jgi:CMP-N,N'-diacetyllegionaminic acid synthase